MIGGKLDLFIDASWIFHVELTSLIIPLPFVLLNLEKVERKRKKYKNLKISRIKRAFQMK